MSGWEREIVSDGSSGNGSTPPLQSWTAQVTNIVDGDTFDVIWLDGYSLPVGLQDRIRVAGVDTNEIAKDDVPVTQPFADAATARLAELIPVGSIVTLYARDEASESLGRPVRHVFDDAGQNVAAVLIEEGLGLATSYEFEPDYREEYFTAVERAIVNEVGMWEPGASGGPDPSTWPEIMVFVNYDATGDDLVNLNDEFLHIENKGPGSLDLSGWSFRKDGRAAQSEFPDGTILAVGEFFRVYVGAGTDTANSMYLGEIEPFFNNDHDVVYLRDEFLNMRGYQSWPDSQFTGPEASIVIEDVQFDAPGLDEGNANGEWGILRNAGDETVDLSYWRLKDDSNDYVFAAGEMLDAGESLKIYVGSGTDSGNERYWGNPDSILINEGGKLELWTPLSTSVDAFTWGDGTHEGENPRGAIKLTANYNAEGSDGSNPNGEWVALFNSSQSAIDLTGFSLVSGPQTYAFEAGTMLEAGANLRVLIGAGTDSALVKYWGNSGAILTNGGDEVNLLNAEAEVILQHSWPDGNARLTDFGIVIDRVNFDAPGDDTANPNGEWLTLRNASSADQNLVNWQPNAGPNHHYTFLEDRVLTPGEVLTIYIGSGTDTDSAVYWGKSGGILTNDGSRAIDLLTPDRTVVETHSWGSAASPEQSVGAAVELSLNYDAVGTDETNPNGEWVNVTNLSSSTISLDGYHLYTDGTSYAFDSGDTIEAGARMRVYLGSGADNGLNRYADGALSAFNNDGDEIALRLNATEGVVSSFTFPFDGPALIAGTFAITAVNYDAPGNDTDNPNGEWFEITNTGSSAANLMDWRVQYATATFYDFHESMELNAGETLRIYMGSGTNTDTTHFWGRANGTLSNTEGTLELQSNYRVTTGSMIWNTASDSNDTVYGTDGADLISTGGGNDRVFGLKGNDIIELGEGNDYVKAGGGAEEFHGGVGKDYLSYYDSTGGVTINLTTDAISGSWAANDTISGFESFSGSNIGGDRVTGTDGANTIKTYGGNDRVAAGKGTDVVELGAGNDYVRVGGGLESFDGVSGTDYISYFDSTGGITIDMEANTVSGSWAVNDTVTNFESASGSGTGGDTMYGNTSANTLKGFGGNDSIYGRSGTDLLYGGANADIFHFDLGDDIDTIKDFENNIDTIELDNFSFAPGEDAFDFASQVGSDVVFDFGGGDMLTVENITIGQLSNDLVLV